MTNVWISASYALGVEIRGQGLWCAPSLRLAGQTEIVPATDSDDALRVGCAMAILAALDQLGDSLIFHIPATPRPNWLFGSRYPVPLGARSERLRYTTVIDAWLLAHPGGFIVSDKDIITMDALREHAPMCADYDMYSVLCQACHYPEKCACARKEDANG